MATAAQAKQFIKEIAPIVQKYAKQYGYKVASPIIAQACIESAFNTSSLGFKYHNYFGMKCGSAEKEAVLFSRLIDVPYIEYKRFVPKESRTFVELSRDSLSNSLERASIVTEERVVGQAKSMVRFRFEDQTLGISALSVAGNFFDELPIEKKGDDIDIYFPCKYLIEILRATDDDLVPLLALGREGKIADKVGAEIQKEAALLPFGPFGRDFFKNERGALLRHRLVVVIKRKARVLPGAIIKIGLFKADLGG
jgi:hypothetical protein